MANLLCIIFPIEAQFSPIYGMVCADFNGDGNDDVLCAGNSYSGEVQSGRYDAQGTVLLEGNGKGGFAANRNALNVTGDNKAIARLTGINGSSYILISSNDDSLRTFRMNGILPKSVVDLRAKRNVCNHL